MFLPALGFSFHAEVVAGVRMFTQATQSLQPGAGRGGKGGGVFNLSGVCGAPQTGVGQVHIAYSASAPRSLGKLLHLGFWLQLKL